MCLIRDNIDRMQSHPELGCAAVILKNVLHACLETTKFFAEAGKSGDFLLPVLTAGKFLEIFGDLLVGHFLLDAGSVADKKLKDIYAVLGASSSHEQKALIKETKEAAFYHGGLRRQSSLPLIL
jgi:hypothetical protein